MEANLVLGAPYVRSSTWTSPGSAADSRWADEKLPLLRVRVHPRSFSEGNSRLARVSGHPKGCHRLYGRGHQGLGDGGFQSLSCWMRVIGYSEPRIIERDEDIAEAVYVPAGVLRQQTEVGCDEAPFLV